MIPKPFAHFAACFAALTTAATANGEIAFERFVLSTDFTCEGANFADLDRDGAMDVIAGPFWYAGPDWKVRRELYEPKTFDPHGYSDNFFVWTEDFDGDGWLDILLVGFPGKDASWLRNPCGNAATKDSRWERFAIHSNVDNESPAYVDLNGDGVRELVFHSTGQFGWASPNAADPRAPWEFHPFSSRFRIGPFTHGLGVGDVNGDGRLDVMWKEGWFEQPAKLDGAEWPFHPFKFSEREGGAQMFAYDVDGDGDNDVITSLAAHHFGLSWFENVRADGAITFREHRFMDDEPSDSPHGACFCELHALDLVDMNGDGALDIVTGKRWWSHGPDGDPQPGSKADTYWFELVRGEEGPQFVPHLASDDCGVGVQVVAGDVNGDARPDIVVGNKRGVFVLVQRAEPKKEKRTGAATKPTLDFEGGDLRGWTLSGDAFVGQPVRGDTVSARGREASRHAGEYWIGGYEKLGDKLVGSMLSDPFEVEAPFASFLIGGGGHADTCVEILAAEDGRKLFTSSGANFESLQRVVVDLRTEVGRSIRIRIVDEQTGHWGHVNFDDFQFHLRKPQFDRPEGVPAIFPPDPIVHAGLKPEEARAAMSVPPGFHVDLIAAEPDVHQPIALAIDDLGRLWVAEAFAYPNRAKGDKGPDDIVVFEDADADGSFEKRTVFASGLNLVSGLEVGFGGVWVGAAPYLMFIPDRDGDLTPDGEPQILLDGWAYQDTHETLNAFTWGPDGWLYGCHGVFTYSNVGKPGAPDSERTKINAGVWRFHPLRHEFEVFAWGTSNPWGIDFDDNGQAFITACVIPHLYHVIQGGRYERQSGEHYDKYAFDDIKTIADHRHYVGGDPHAGNQRSAAVGGGHAHCGLMIYRGEAWPESLRGGMFFGNIHGNRINHDRVERRGSGFVGVHAEDLLVSNDRWFRAINFKEGPDGAVYFIDWYDKQACHWTEQERWDRTNGRIYRVRYGERPARGFNWDYRTIEPGRLLDWAAGGKPTSARRALRQVQERGHDDFAPVSLDRAVGSADARVALNTLWTLHAAQALSEGLARDHMGSSHEYVRAWSIQLVLEDKQAESATRQRMSLLAMNDPSPVVRLYLASGLQRLPLEQRWEIAEQLARRAEDADDPNIPLMLWYGVEPLVAADPARALVLAREAKIPVLARFIARRAAADARLHAALVAAIAKEDRAEHLSMLLEETVRSLETQRALKAPEGWAAAFTALSKHADEQVREHAKSIAAHFGDPTQAPELRKTAADVEAPAAERQRAIEMLARLDDPQLPALLRRMLGDAPMQGAAIRALAEFGGDEDARTLLTLYPNLPVPDRRDAIATLSSRVSFASQLVDALEAGRVPRADVGAFVVRKIESLGDEALTARMQRAWGAVRETSQDKAARIAELKKTLGGDALASADPRRGRDVFVRTCQQCHTLFGAGGEVGPELTGANRADLDYLLSNIVDPNAVVGRDYLATLVWTHDGRLVSGVERSSNDSTVVLETENETVYLAREDIELMRVSDLSTMPEGLLETLRPHEIKDLIAYLQSPSQVLLRTTPATAHLLFDGRTLANWSGADCWSVENGEIVGKTTGLERNEFLKSSLELEDFDLRFEVRLVGNQGNSGVQFRSRVTEDGDVAGYQADIGKGWWGKLYEEHGRALLESEDRDSLVVPDGWNRYRIEVRGTQIRTWLNDQLCVDFDDPAGEERGILALQLHSGGPTEVRFRNFALKVFE